LRRGSSVLIGGVFERLTCPEGRDLNKPIFKSSNAQGVARGIPRAFDCASCPRRGEFEHCVGRVGNLNWNYPLF